PGDCEFELPTEHWSLWLTHRIVLLLACSLLAGCGAVASSNGQARQQSGSGCVAPTNGLLTAAEVSPDLTQWTEGSGAALGLWNNGDTAYPNFKVSAARIFLWSGLYAGTPRALVTQAWANLHYSGTAPVSFIPKTGALFSTYPSQTFRVAEARLDF